MFKPGDVVRMVSNTQDRFADYSRITRTDGFIWVIDQVFPYSDWDYAIRLRSLATNQTRTFGMFEDSGANVPYTDLRLEKADV